MRIPSSTSLQELDGQITNNDVDHQEDTNIIESNYLKNIHNKLVEEESTAECNQNSEIFFTTALLQGVSAEIMTDTGASVSLIDKGEFNLSLIHI